jgi:integrase
MASLRSSAATLKSPTKPKKPRPDFPLFPHATRRWAKKIRGKLHYFGPWADPQAALNKYLDQKDDLHAGRRPRIAGGALRVHDVLNHFLIAKRHLRDTSEITARTWADYHATCERIGKAFGVERPVDDLRAEDFSALRGGIAEVWGPVRLGNEVQRVRTIFKHAYESGLIDRPVRFGPDFKKPNKKVMRLNRAKRGERMFEPNELRQLIKAATPPLETMILLGVNCGYGNADMATLEYRHLDLKKGWADFARGKTGIARRCPLWPETIKSINAWLKVRPEPKDAAHADRVFITKYGASWDKGSEKGKIPNAIGHEMKKLLDRLGLYRPGLGLYTLRHVHRTVADETHDRAAIDLIMGHAADDMGSVYRERIADDRLQRVAEHVHKWVFAAAKAKTAKRRA